MANLRGFAIMMGHRAKQITKQASAPRLHPPNINKRSHLLTVDTECQPLSASLEQYEQISVTVFREVG